MGRYTSVAQTQAPNQQYSNISNNSQSPSNTGWPTVFPKELVAIDRNSVITSNTESIIYPNQIQIISESLDAIRTIRLKGYRVVIFYNEPAISKGLATPELIDAVNQELMGIFGRAGILSIDGLLYSTSDYKQDVFAMPNTGMLKRAENELKVSFKGGYFVGAKYEGLKAGQQAGATPVLVNSPFLEETNTKLSTFSNKEWRNKVKRFPSLQQFAQSLA